MELNKKKEMHKAPIVDKITLDMILRDGNMKTNTTKNVIVSETQTANKVLFFLGNVLRFSAVILCFAISKKLANSAGSISLIFRYRSISYSSSPLLRLLMM